MTGGETSTQQQMNSDVGPLVLILHKKLNKTDISSKRKEILLPNRAAKSYLPSLMMPEYSTVLAVEDLKTGQIWSFKYKFWPRGAGSYLLAKTEHFVDHHKLEAGDMIKLYKSLSDNHLVIEAVKRGQASCGPTVTPATIARRRGAQRISSIRKSPKSEVLPPGFI